MKASLFLFLEGETEEAIVKRVLRPHLAGFGLDLGTPKHFIARGAVNGDRIIEAISIGAKRHSYASSLCDYQGFRNRQSLGHDIDQIEQAIWEKLGKPPSVRIYLQSYEIEALVLSSPEKCAEYMVSIATSGVESIDTIVRFIEQDLGRLCDVPESVNDGAETKPSARLDKYFRRFVGRGYRKTIDTPKLFEGIGLQDILGKCPRFAAWLRCLETRIPAPEGIAG